jgi:hypothetical protein
MPLHLQQRLPVATLTFWPYAHADRIMIEYPRTITAILQIFSVVKISSQISMAELRCQIPREIHPGFLSRRSVQYSIAKPPFPVSAGGCSTRRTAPLTSTGRGPISSGTPSSAILSATYEPTGGQRGAITNAPCSLTSRLRPSPCWCCPFPFVHEKVTAVRNGNRMVLLDGRPQFNPHPQEPYETHITIGVKARKIRNVIRNTT